MKKYCERYDVYYEDQTREYLEGQCKDPDCEFCAQRPKKLSDRCKSCHFELTGGSICKGLKPQ